MTLVEILVVVAIIGVLLAAIGLIGSRLREKGKRDLTRGTMDRLVTAIEDFHANVNAQALLTEWSGCPVASAGCNRGSASLWPLAPNDPCRTKPGEAFCDDPPSPLRPRPYEPGQDGDTVKSATQEDYYLGYQQVPQPGMRFYVLKPPWTAAVPAEGLEIRSIEGLYLYLSTVPTAKAIVDKLPESAKANAHKSPPQPEQPLRASAVPTLVSQFIDPIEILDAWGKPLRYRLYNYRNNGRPFLWSAGPDGRFAADPNRPDQDPAGADDIFSDKKE